MLTVLAYSNTPRGRKNLAEELRIGEGIVRTLLEGGRDLGHVTVLKGGVKITELGIAFLRDALKLCNIGMVFPVDAAKNLLCGKRCFAQIVNAPVGNVLMLRDVLVRLGSCGALIVRQRGGQLVLPPSDDDLINYSPILAEVLRPHLSQDNTAVITCGEVFADALTMIQYKCSETLLGGSDERNPADE